MSRRKNAVESIERMAMAVGGEGGRQGIHPVAESVMEKLERRLGSPLCELLRVQLLGFSALMQMEMADCLLGYARDKVVGATGCPSADNVLEWCYAWIEAEANREH